MLVTKPPMGWNSWNTFGRDISEDLILQTADAMVRFGFRDAGYEYVVIDDCWAEKQRKNGRLVPDAEKFPRGIKALAEEIHARGLKLGIYSCAGVRTCQNYPGSFDHEFIDAETFAEWGVDFLKYDYCNLPKTANGKLLYHRMGNALRACGRDILFSACNWGEGESYRWMRGAGAHMYRSTGDIFDCFVSFRDIAKSQFDFLYASGPNCFNDMDMLTVGMNGAGNVGAGGCTWDEYVMQFSLWCFCGVPLMLGCDLRNLPEDYRNLLLNKNLISLNQDAECRPPVLVTQRYENRSFVRQLENGGYAVGFFNLDDKTQYTDFFFEDAGIPVSSGYCMNLQDVMTGEEIKGLSDHFSLAFPSRSCRIFFGELVRM